MFTDTLHHHTPRSNRYRQIEQVLQDYDPIYLAEMDDVALLNRIDTKYLLPLSGLQTILGQMHTHYRVLDINRIRLNRYHTVYFDEPDFRLYNQHHNHHADRHKVRARRYVDTNLAFFEVKHKTNQDRTIKSRLPLADGTMRVDHTVTDFIDAHAPVDVQNLEPKLWNDYLRLTLVGKTRAERVTVDLDLSFGWQNATAELPGVAIAEVKQGHFSQDSQFIQQMRGMGLRPTSFSKYCMGVTMLYDGVKANNFKPGLLKVSKIMQQEAQYGSHR